MSFRMGQTSRNLNHLHEITKNKVTCAGMNEKEKKKSKSNLLRRTTVRTMMKKLNEWKDIETEVGIWEDSRRRGIPYNVRAQSPKVQAAIAEIRGMGYQPERRRSMRNTVAPETQPIQQLQLGLGRLTIASSSGSRVSPPLLQLGFGPRVPPPRPPPPRPPPPRTTNRRTTTTDNKTSSVTLRTRNSSR